MEESKCKPKNWNKQNKKRYLAYLTKVRRQNGQKQLIITHSHWKHISPYIFKQNYIQRHVHRSSTFHSDKLKKYKNVDQIIDSESKKYFQDKQIQKYVQQIKQWEHQKQLAKVNWNLQEKVEKNNQNQMKQIKGWYIMQVASQDRQQLNYLQENQQSDQEQQPDKYVRTYTINPTITIVDEQQPSSVLKQQNNSWTNQNHQSQLSSFPLLKIFQQYNQNNRIKKLQTAKRAYQFETIVELDLPQILIANTQQTLMRYLKSEQFQKTKDSSVQFQNQQQADTVKFQNRLYYLSQQINCLKKNIEVQSNEASVSNTTQNQITKQQVKQMLLEIKIPYTLYFEYQFQQEDQKNNLTKIRNSFTNNLHKMVDQQEINYQKDKQEKIIQQSDSNESESQSYSRKQVNQQQNNSYKRDKSKANGMVQEQQQNKDFRKQKNKPLKKKNNTTRKPMQFWTPKQRIKALAFIEYHLDQKYMDYLKMATYIPNKKIKNCTNLIQAIRQANNNNLRQCFCYSYFRQGLYQKKKKLNQKQLKIFQGQMRFLRQFDKEWTNQRFLLFKDSGNKNEYLIFNPHFRLPVQRIKRNYFDRSLIYLKNNKVFLKVQYYYKQKEVASSIQKMQEQRNPQKGKIFLSEQDQYTTKSIEIQQKKLKRSPKRWNQLENIRYLIFIIKNREILQETDRWIKQGIVCEMSKFIKSRSAQKCQSKHQNMLSKYGSIQKIIQYLKSIIQDKDLFENQLRQYETYQTNIQEKVSYLQYKIIRFSSIQEELDCKNSKNLRNFLKINQQIVLEDLKQKIQIKLPKKILRNNGQKRLTVNIKILVSIIIN